MKKVLITVEDKDAMAKETTKQTWEYLLLRGIKAELEDMKRGRK